VTGLTTAEWLTSGPDKTGGFVNAGAWVQGFPYPVLSALPYIIITGSESRNPGQALGAVSIGGIVNQSGNTVAANTGGIAWISSAGTNASAGSYVLGGKGATAAGYQVVYRGTDTVTAAVTPPGGSSGAGGSLGTGPSSGSGISSATGTFTVESVADAAYGYLGVIGLGLPGYNTTPFAGLASTPGGGRLVPRKFIPGQFGFGSGSNGFDLLTITDGFTITDGGVNKPSS
jgi:hypothetical protein